MDLQPCGGFSFNQGEPTHVPQMLIDAGHLSLREIAGWTPPQSTEEEERGIATQSAEVASGEFERTRAQVRDALRAIIGSVITAFNIPCRQGGIDIGSGATGEMVNQLLKPYIQGAESSWAQVEINPKAVAMNRKRNPLATVIEGSYFQLANDLRLQNTNMIAGLSCLDATYFLPQVIASVRNSLRENGYLLHIQDVRPGDGVGFRYMQRHGYQLPYKALMLPNGNPLLYPVQNGMAISVGEMLREELGDAITNTPDMELLYNGWVEAHRAPPHNIARLYYLNTLLGVAPPAEESISAIITVARKKAA